MQKKLVLIQTNINQLRGRPNISHPYPFEPLALEIIAGLTPEDWAIKIIDERIDPIQLDNLEEADLVGLTSYTASAPRAYEIAQAYKKKGIPTVMGGIHASTMPKEALNYVQTVVTGEAESIWGEVISDFEANEMQRLYKGGFADMRGMSMPRKDIIPTRYHYSTGTLQTGRGCPNNCDFCSVTLFNGFRYRKMPVENVWAELEGISQNVVFFLDDNLIGYSKKDMDYAIRLFKGIVERNLNKILIVQSDFKIAQDEVLKYAALSGCRVLNIGIEAEDPSALKAMNKRVNLKIVNKYKELFELIHKYGIAISGNLIFGLDTDTPESLQRRTDFIINSDLDAVRIAPITPLPGTRLFKKLQQEGRLIYTDFPNDWKYYDLQTVVFSPAMMKAEELSESIHKSNRILFSDENIEKRFQTTLNFTDESTAYMLKAINVYGQK